MESTKVKFVIYSINNSNISVKNYEDNSSDIPNSET